MRKSRYRRPRAASSTSLRRGAGLAISTTLRSGSDEMTESGKRIRLAARLDLDDARRRRARSATTGDSSRTSPPCVLDRVGHRVPHLAGPEARVVELGDEALDLVPLVAEERRLRRREERQPLDALRRPLGADLGRRHAPHLLGVGLEEQLEEPAAEPVRHPVLERLVASCRARRRHAGTSAMQRVSSTGPELPDHVGAAQRVVEVAVVPVDPRHARAEQELLAEDLVPERVDLDRLREEAVAAEIEAIAVALDRLREPADLVLRLEHDERRARRVPSR